MPPHDQGSALSRRRFLVVGGAACAVPSLIGAQQAAAATQYTLNVINNSGQFQDVCLYAEPSDLGGPPSAMALAWLVAPSGPPAPPQVTFTWSLDYSFVWAQTGVLTVGRQFGVVDQVAADPYDLTRNQILFGAHDNQLAFTTGTAGDNPQPGSLYVKQLSSVPANTASVGIGLNGSAVCAVQAQPDTLLEFTPRANGRYRLAAGVFGQGEVLDVELITNYAEIAFTSGLTMNAVLGPDNLWSVGGDAIC